MHQLEVERVTTLFEQSKSALAANSLTGLFSCIVLHQQLGRMAWSWFAAMVAVLALRAWQYRRFLSVSRDRRLPEIWFRRYGWGIFLTGSLWGLLGSYAVSIDDVPINFFMVAVLVGMVGGSVATCAVSVRIFLAFSLPTLLPPAVLLISGGDRAKVLIGILLLVYGAVVTRSVVQIKGVIIESIRHRFENERLLREREREKQQVEASEARLRQAFDKLEAAHQKLVEQRSLVDRERDISARLREVDRLKDEFLANTSHELRTPLYGMAGLAEALIDGVHGRLPAAAETDLSMIVTSSRRLTRLVNDILDFSKLRHDKLELRKKPVDLRSSTEIVLTLSRPTLKDGVELRNRVPRDLPRALADEDRLLQILHNLLDNAIKFTRRGTVEISAAAVDGEIRVSVRDTGIGIGIDDQGRIFEAFEQADSSAERAFGGTGLGLAVTRRLVELHGGEIRVESEEGHGAAFHFTLPSALEGDSPATPPELSPPNLSPPAPEAEAGAAAAGTAQAGEIEPDVAPAAAEHHRIEASSVEPRARILAVDDEPVNLRILHHFLHGEPIELIEASGGREALDIVERSEIDLVLLDVMMPEISGYEVCRRLRRRYRASDLPILFLTAKDREQDLETGFSLGANDYIAKPIAKAPLLSRIRLHLALLRSHRDLEALVADKISQLKVLHGLLPICAQCKKIRDEGGDWHELESFVASHTEAQFSHGLCPDCLQAYMQTARKVP